MTRPTSGWRGSSRWVAWISQRRLCAAPAPWPMTALPKQTVHRRPRRLLAQLRRGLQSTRSQKARARNSLHGAPAHLPGVREPTHPHEGDGLVVYQLKHTFSDGTTHGLRLRASCPAPFGPACGCSKSFPTILSSPRKSDQGRDVPAVRSGAASNRCRRPARLRFSAWLVALQCEAAEQPTFGRVEAGAPVYQTAVLPDDQVPGPPPVLVDVVLVFHMIEQCA